MTWESFYLICFLVGFLLSLVSFLAEAVHFHGGHVHMHSGHGPHAGAHGAHAHVHSEPGISKLNFSTATAFLAWFGGTGYLIERYASIWIWLGFALSAIAGMAGASIVFWFLAKLVARDRTLDPADYDMIGVLGQVSCRVHAGGVGEMIFTQDGARRAVPIRSDTGGAIEHGTEVVVTRYERGIGYVRRWDELAGEAEGSAPNERATEPRPSGSGAL
jgi:membrane protein implicated in regulation of membrane protease activity